MQRRLRACVVVLLLGTAWPLWAAPPQLDAPVHEAEGIREYRFDNGLALVAGATHPFADWRVQDISPDERYLQVVEDLQLVARSNLIFGLHVHIGVEDRETIIHLMNQIRYFLPHYSHFAKSRRGTGYRHFSQPELRRRIYCPQWKEIPRNPQPQLGRAPN